MHADLSARTGLNPTQLSQGLIRSHQIKFPVTLLVSLSQWPAGKPPASKSEKEPFVDVCICQPQPWARVLLVQALTALHRVQIVTNAFIHPH